MAVARRLARRLDRGSDGMGFRFVMLVLHVSG